MKGLGAFLLLLILPAAWPLVSGETAPAVSLLASGITASADALQLRPPANGHTVHRQ